MATPISIELLVAGRDLTEPRLSPDGGSVAFVQSWRRASAIMVVPADGGIERIVTIGPDPDPGRGMGGGCYEWWPDGRGLVYVASDGELWSQPLDDVATPLTSIGRPCRSPVVDGSGSMVVFVVDEAEVWAIRIVDGQPGETPTRLDDGEDEFCFDPAISPDSAAISWQAWSPPSMPWDAAVIVTVQRNDHSGWGQPQRTARPGASMQQPGFLPDGTPTVVHDGSGWLNIHVGDDPMRPEPFEQAGPQWGMRLRSYVPSPDGSMIAFCRNETGFGRLCIFDRASTMVTDVGKGGHGQLTWRGDRLVALRTGAVTPTQIVCYDTSDLSRKPQREVLAVGPPIAWSSIDLPEPELITASAGDITLHARRYNAGSGRMLCWVHGGPTDQWQADFRPRISYWWSRGWDVLVVDPRGTTGHGRAYQQALNGGWGRIDVDDTADLIRHAHLSGWATPQTTLIMGGSAGGLSVLGVLADHPDLVAGGVAAYPVSDIEALASSTHRFEAHYTDTLVGSSSFVELSPIHRAAQISSPLLIFHGSDDPVVPIGQSRQIVEAIERAGGSVELVEYEGEGHGFRDPVNVRDEYTRTERFVEANCRQPGGADR